LSISKKKGVMLLSIAPFFLFMDVGHRYIYRKFYKIKTIDEYKFIEYYVLNGGVLGGLKMAPRITKKR
jgi:hypothetical protein